MTKPGTYVGTIVNHAMADSKAGNPQAVITFSFETDAGPQQMRWYGGFLGKGKDITIKTLLACGLKGNNPAGSLEIGRKMLLIIDNETDAAGKTRTKIKWVNPVRGVRNMMSPDLAIARLSELEGAVMAARDEHGFTDPDKQEIPF